MPEGDYDGLEAFREDKKPKARLRKLKASPDASILEQLRVIVKAKYDTVINLFRQWDDDGNGQINAVEFRHALPALGIIVPREDADAFFAEFDEDDSGEISYEELHKQLRSGAEVELDAALQAGAMGEIETASKNAIALRGGVLNRDIITMFGNETEFSESSEVPVVEQLKRALGAPTVLARVVDIFRQWDEDGSGTVSKREFARALPMLGLRVARERADELFDLIDTDRSGSLEYGELHRKLRKTANGGGLGGSSSLPALRPRPRGSAVSIAAGTDDTRALVREAHEAEKAAKVEMLRMMKRLREAEKKEAALAQRARISAIGAAVRAETDARVGRDLNDAISRVPVASTDLVKEIATQLYAQVCTSQSTPP